MAAIALLLRTAMSQVSLMCASYHTCDTCTILPSCGWCESLHRCLEGSLSGPSVTPCSAGWAPDFCATAACGRRADCATCLAGGGDDDAAHPCGWCTKERRCYGAATQLDGTSLSPCLPRAIGGADIFLSSTRFDAGECGSSGRSEDTEEEDAFATPDAPPLLAAIPPARTVSAASLLCELHVVGPSAALFAMRPTASVEQRLCDAIASLLRVSADRVVIRTITASRLRRARRRRGIRHTTRALEPMREDDGDGFALSATTPFSFSLAAREGLPSARIDLRIDVVDYNAARDARDALTGATVVVLGHTASPLAAALAARGLALAVAVESSAIELDVASLQGGSTDVLAAAAARSADAGAEEAARRVLLPPSSDVGSLGEIVADGGPQRRGSLLGSRARPTTPTAPTSIVGRWRRASDGASFEVRANGRGAIVFSSLAPHAVPRQCPTRLTSKATFRGCWGATATRAAVERHYRQAAANRILEIDEAGVPSGYFEREYWFAVSCAGAAAGCRVCGRCAWGTHRVGGCNGGKTDAVCEPCSRCAAGHFRAGGCSGGWADSRCEPCARTCGVAGEFIVGGCADGVGDVVCAPCRGCAAGSFRAAGCDGARDGGHLDAQCARCAPTPMVPVPHYRSGGCTGSQDAQFMKCSVCPAGYFELTACTALADTVCTACSACLSGAYRSGGCVGALDSQCEACRTCPAGHRRAHDRGCSGSEDAYCVPCNACPEGEYRVAGSCEDGLSDSACAPCAACPPEHYRVGGCNGTANSLCAPW